MRSNKASKHSKVEDNFYHKPSLISNFTHNCEKNKQGSDKKHAFNKKTSLYSIDNKHFSAVSKKGVDKNKQNLIKSKISYLSSQRSLDTLKPESKEGFKSELMFSKPSLVNIITNDQKTDNIRWVFGKIAYLAFWFLFLYGIKC